MIVVCENCSSRFLVDPTVLQPTGRRVRCARCKHIWFQAPPEPEVAAPAPTPQATVQEDERRQVFRRDPFEEASGQPASAEASPEPGVQDDNSYPQDDTADENDDLYADDPTGDLDDDLGEDDDDEVALPWNQPKKKRPAGKTKTKTKATRAQVPALYKKRSPMLVAAGWAALAALLLSAVGTAIFARESIASKIPAIKPVYAAIGLEIPPKIITENVGRYLTIETPPPQPAYWRDNLLIQEITGTIINKSDAPVKVPNLEGILRDQDNKELYRWDFAPQAGILYPGQKAAFATEIIDLPQEAAEMELVFSEPKAAQADENTSR